MRVELLSYITRDWELFVIGRQIEDSAWEWTSGIDIKWRGYEMMINVYEVYESLSEGCSLS